MDGSGQANETKTGYTYPPLWGAHSYTDAAGMFRISRLAGFIKNNMPHPINYHQPKLSTDMAWDLAAYINSQPRPHKTFLQDWPDISKNRSIIHLDHLQIILKHHNTNLAHLNPLLWQKNAK